MFYKLFLLFGEQLTFLNLFRYITFRCMASLLTAFILSLLLGPSFIAALKKIQKRGQPIRIDGPQQHRQTKAGTPTMGGILILITMISSTVLWGNLKDIYLWLVLGVTLGFAIIGFIDDFLKIGQNSSKGLPGRIKFLVQGMCAFLFIYMAQQYMAPSMASHLYFPFLKGVSIDLGLFFIPFAIIVITGASNAVNLTDGLDGLATGPFIVASAVFAIIAYVSGNSVFAEYLQIPHVIGVGEVSVLLSALVGAGLGFLWFNTPPAMVFMGDTGSLAIGAVLGAVSVITKHEIVLALVGGIFVIEAGSVILQVLYFKITKGKRIFLMAPLHHHFEHKGWSEPTIVMRFWIIAFVLGLIGLATLKIR